MKVSVPQQLQGADSTIILKDNMTFEPSGLVAAAHPPPSNDAGHGAQGKQGHDHTASDAGAVEERDGERNACHPYAFRASTERHGGLKLEPSLLSGRRLSPWEWPGTATNIVRM